MLQSTLSKCIKALSNNKVIIHILCLKWIKCSFMLINHIGSENKKEKSAGKGIYIMDNKDESISDITINRFKKSWLISFQKCICCKNLNNQIIIYCCS